MRYFRLGAVFLVCSSAVAHTQTYGPDFQATSKTENEFSQLVRDVLGTLRGMPDRSAVEHACIDSTLRGATQLSTIFSHYKFAIASWNILSDEFEKKKVALVLKVQTTQVREEIRATRERINGAVGTCGRFPLAVAKGTELLGAMKKADEVVSKIESKL